jgi:hypothetical protein
MIWVRSITMGWMMYSQVWFPAKAQAFLHHHVHASHRANVVTLFWETYIYRENHWMFINVLLWIHTGINENWSSITGIRKGFLHPILCYACLAHLNKAFLCFNISISVVGPQGNPYTSIIFWSILHPHLLYSASSPVPLTINVYLSNKIWMQLIFAIFSCRFLMVCISLTRTGELNSQPLPP